MTVEQLFQEFTDLSHNNREKGDYYERFIKKYLCIDPVNCKRFEKVWLWMEFPYRDAKPDTGIDIVAQEKNGDFCAIQCKFFAPNTKINKNDIDSFLSASGKSFIVDGKETFFSSRLLVISTELSKHAEDSIQGQKIPVTCYGLYDFLDNDTIDWSGFSLSKPEQIKKKRNKEIRPHQQEALDKVVDGFCDRDRGKLIMACGTGKTYTSLRIAEKMAGSGGTVLVLMPSISLLSQTIREWLNETIVNLGCIPVCSDVKVGKRDDSDEIVMSPGDIIFPASTNEDTFIKRYNDCNISGMMKVVFSTYQSIDVINRAQKRLGFEFDLIICDEAHRTTGVTLSKTDESYFIKVHDNNFIKAKKRLYMTATPRIYSDASKNKADISDVMLASMDDVSIFGEEFYTLSFGKAVEEKLLSDYKVIILTVNETYADKKLQTLLSEDGELKLEDMAKIMGCWNGLSKRKIDDSANPVYQVDPAPMKRAVAFNSTIKGSKQAMEYIKTIQKDNVEKDLIRMSIEHVDGSMNSMERNKKLSWLKEEAEDGECRILTNARCLSEGVDVPSLDAVIFLSPRGSIVDIIQSVGRVMRTNASKLYGYIILPVVIPAGIAPEAALSDNKRFRVIWSVLQALRTHDDRFNHIINTLEFNKHKNDKINILGIGDYGNSETAYIQGSLDFETETYSLNDWCDAIISKTIAKCGDKDYWETWAKGVSAIAVKHIKRITDITADKGGAVAKAFDEFVHSLRVSLNDSITESDAVEMLSQHLITKPVFEALFEGYSFVKQNPVSIAMQKVIENLNDEELENETSSLKEFYKNVRFKAQGVDTAEGKQKIIIELYDKFFKVAFPKTVDKLGIVYTPVELVDFIVRSVQEVLKKYFDKQIDDKNVHIIDPFTGTGTFIVRLLQSGLISKEALLYKYINEIHANEIVLLAYYIAAINIEAAFHDIMELDEYRNFEGIVLTDTFALEEDKGSAEEISAMQGVDENSSRLLKQKKCDIKVIIGNPPFSVGQKSENDNNKNVSYPRLEKSIADTYVKNSDNTNKNSLYDSYIKAFRWASDRLNAGGGIVCFVSNGGFIDNLAMSGFRKCLAKEFSYIYCFNLRGDQRTSGELSRKEGGKIFGSGSRAQIAITMLIKEHNHKGDVEIFYNDIGDYLTREEKLSRIGSSSLESLKWTKITPDSAGDWINHRNQAFDEFIVLGDNKKGGTSEKVFEVYSSGVMTGRDAWVYNFNKDAIKSNVSYMINNYNLSLTNYTNGIISIDKIEQDPSQIKLSEDLKKHFKKRYNINFQPAEIKQSLYRPFCKQYLYYGENLIDRRYQMLKLFPTSNHKNVVIIVNGIGGKKEFTSLITNTIPDRGCIGACQCFPLYYYEKHDGIAGLEFEDVPDEYGYIRKESVTDYIFNEYKNRFGKEITKEDIFYYIYGLLHSEEYRTKFSNDLKKMLPRIPFVKTKEDFLNFSFAGKKLAELHLNYENAEPYPLNEKITGKANYRVEKMKFAKTGKKDDKSVIFYNNCVTLSGIPLETYEYIVNGQSALEWVMERYCIKTDKDSKIINDANKWNFDERYILDLIKRVVTVSLETIEIVKKLPELNVE